MNFSWIIALKKSFNKGLLPILGFVVGLIVLNPGIIDQLLGSTGQMTIAAGVIYLLRLLENWLKNK